MEPVRDLAPVLRPDGRRLQLGEVGDPGGVPALYLHGTGSSRLEVALFDEAARRHGVRLIAWNRPGAGESTDQTDRRVLDVVADARAVAEATGADRPVVLGHSGGGCHVLALAVVGGDVVRAAIAINPGPPAEDAVLADLPASIRFSIRAARDRPRLFAVLAHALQDGRGPFARALQRRSLDATDLAVVEAPAHRPVFEAAKAEGSAQPDAYVREALVVWGRPWEVGLHDFAVPLTVYAGRRDAFMGFALRLGRAGAALQWFDGGHVSCFAPAVLDRIMATTVELSGRSG